jgi:3'(2'), 5'-bisphosphate nucleotidase
MTGTDLSGILNEFRATSPAGMNSVIEQSGNKLVSAILAKAERLTGRSRIGQEQGRIRVAGSRSHGDQKLSDFVQDLRSRYGEVEHVAVGSSLKFCLVAEGSADIYPRFGPTMEWDTGAGDIIVREAGGTVVVAENGTPLCYNKENLLNPAFIAYADSRSVTSAGRK